MDPAYYEWLRQQQQAQSGVMAPPQAAAPPAAAPPASAPTSGSLGAYGNRLESWNRGKLADANHKTPKYLAGKVFSQFDPTKGTQQGMLDQLNALGIGQFSGSIGGDKLRITNPTGDGWGDFRGGEIDYIRDLGRGGYHWGRNLDRPQGGGQAAAVQGALGGNPAYARGFAGGAPHAASTWLQQLLSSLGVSI